MLEEYEGENEQLKQERYKSNIERNKFEDLMHQVEDKEQEIHSLQEEFKNRSVSQANVSLYEQTIQEKNREI
jgi:predicted acetyltransferase